jgi:hypothetical protein
MAWAGKKVINRHSIVAVLLLGISFFPALRANPSAMRHDFHVSITELNYNPQMALLEITVKIFVDDLERSIAAIGGGKLHLGEASQAANADSILYAYLQNRMVIELNDQAPKMNWVGSEVEQDAVWCYLEISGIPQFSSLKITNRILSELFDDQANVVHVKANGQTKSLYLNESHWNDRVSL